MISLADLQPLSIAKINIFHQQPRFNRQIYHSVKIHASEVSEEVHCIKCDLLIRCVTVPVSVDSQKHLHKPSNLVLNVFALTGNV